LSTLNWIGGAGAQSWATAGNWDTGVAPVTGDSVNILTGTSDIQTGLAQSAVLLANLVIGGSFTGTIASAALAPLQIGATKWIVNSASGRIVLDFGSSTYTGVVISTGNAVDSGLQPLRIRGGSASSKLYVAGSSSLVGLATDSAGLTATINEWNVQDGTLDIAAGVTWINGYQAGGSTVNVNSGGTLIAQSGTQATLNTAGTATIATIDVTGNAVLNHRPAAGTDAFATLNAGPNSTVDFSTDPRPLTITNAINAAIGCTIKAFDPQQLTMHSGAAVQVRTQQCDIADISLDFGSPVLVTISPG
jgi:hypothetical protein